MGRSFALTVVGLAAGFSGLAVLAYVLTPVTLLVAEALSLGIAAVALLVVIRSTPRHVLVEARRLAGAGIFAGAVATLVYDVARTALSLLDPSPYNPFEAIRMFGRGVLPLEADPATILGVGFVIHLLNGTSFGVIFAMFSRGRLHTRRSAVLAGMGWGVALEAVQSILYPGWLGITAVIKEFLLISAAGHLVYGATLGLGVRGLLDRMPDMPRKGLLA